MISRLHLKNHFLEFIFLLFERDRFQPGLGFDLVDLLINRHEIDTTSTHTTENN